MLAFALDSPHPPVLFKPYPAYHLDSGAIRKQAEGRQAAVAWALARLEAEAEAEAAARAQAELELARRRHAAHVQQQQMRERERAHRAAILQERRRRDRASHAARGGRRAFFPPMEMLLSPHPRGEVPAAAPVDYTQALLQLLGDAHNAGTRPHDNAGAHLARKTRAVAFEAPAAARMEPDPEEVDLAVAALAAGAKAVDSEDAFENGSVSGPSESASDDADTEELAQDPPTDADADRAATFGALSRLADDFADHRRAFVSPTTLTFQASTPAPSATDSPASPRLRTPTPPLAYRSSNAPLLAYEEYLVTLLSKLDAVESHGIRDVKSARKELVKQVERELARLDRLKDEAWEEQVSASSSASENSEEEDVERTPEPVEAAGTLSSNGGSDEDSLSDDAEDLADDAKDLADDDDETSSWSSSEDAIESDFAHTVKVPFVLPRAAAATVQRHASPSDAFSASSPNQAPAEDEQLAQLLLGAHHLDHRNADFADRKRARRDDADSFDSEDDSDSETEAEADEMYWVYF
ncbi:hypothetical protein JCM8202_003540 [Rhodotorula sphaerocarpa]